MSCIQFLKTPVHSVDDVGVRTDVAPELPSIGGVALLMEDSSQRRGRPIGGTKRRQDKNGSSLAFTAERQDRRHGQKGPKLQGDQLVEEEKERRRGPE
jgi:hypothetical protein